MIALRLLATLLASTSPEEAYSGGATTSFVQSSKAFAQPLTGLTGMPLRQHSIGNSFFNNNWITAPATASGRDGLGPLYNARSCSACHPNDGKGFLKNNFIERQGTVIKLQHSESNDLMDGDMIYGEQLSDFAIPEVQAEVDYMISRESVEISLPQGGRSHLSRTKIEIEDLHYGALEAGTKLSLRLAPAVFGLGLLEAIPTGALEELADPNDDNNDGISGRLNVVWDMDREQYSVGRFGLKASQPSLRQQTAVAFARDIGITSPLVPEENSTDAQSAVWGGLVHVDPLDATDKVLDRVTTYLQTLAPPARRNVESPAVIAGQELFHAIGCAQCHQAAFTTQANAIIPELSNQVIHPYTDLLLHDMGPGLADEFHEFAATGREWRTAPLWGIGLQLIVSEHNHFLHDGRARNIREAILWHGGEAERSKNNYTRLTQDEVRALHQFLSSL